MPSSNKNCSISTEQNWGPLSVTILTGLPNIENIFVRAFIITCELVEVNCVTQIYFV
ncbi:unnamed protein product [Meloidogyne enterolobii]|uniref:Uncharacterized protein n=1 Tax=Meloidogyne enterolobii TaxID=390850 RepID=A0ACB0XXV1_MELEN